ncbi:hypothetical protein SEA_ABBYDAISY_43 [Arthrobacter phage AbbyDaisy]|nr:hypothetical protein SEA_ABBYDAISY_43 [Arthrobacter phage AbbyDaisy]
MSRQDIDVAAIAILTQRRQHHDRAAAAAQVNAVYVVQTHSPREGASEAELALEETLRDSIIAEAMFHSREADRFEAAIKRAEGQA